MGEPVERISEFIEAFSASLSGNSFVRLSLDNYAGDESGLERLQVRAVTLKGIQKLAFTYRYKTRDIVKNASFADGATLLGDMLPVQFKGASLCTTTYDLRLDKHSSGKITLKKNKPSHSQLPDTHHDRTKNRIVAAGDKAYLQALGVTDHSGKVLAHAQDKFRQINKYIELVNGLLAQLPEGRTLRVVDMGCGKGYLTFALYDHMTATLGLRASVTGVDTRADMVELCNRVANASGSAGLHFVQSSIADYDAGGTDMLVALHACDTATDDAIAKGILAGAGVIVVAPCCHKAIRRQMDASGRQNEVGFLLRHGIFAERQAEMVTDALRALILEYHGYATKVFEFVSDAHTPKNVMITASKKGNRQNRDKTLQAIAEAKAFFGIGTHPLEALLGMQSAERVADR